MVVAFYFRLHLAYFPRPVVAIFARPEHYNTVLLFRASLAYKILSFVEENKTSEEKNDDDSD